MYIQLVSKTWCKVQEKKCPKVSQNAKRSAARWALAEVASHDLPREELGWRDRKHLSLLFEDMRRNRGKARQIKALHTLLLLSICLIVKIPKYLTK